MFPSPKQRIMGRLSLIKQYRQGWHAESVRQDVCSGVRCAQMLPPRLGPCKPPLAATRCCAALHPAKRVAAPLHCPAGACSCAGCRTPPARHRWRIAAALPTVAAVTARRRQQRRRMEGEGRVQRTARFIRLVTSVAIFVLHIAIAACTPACTCFGHELTANLKTCRPPVAATCSALLCRASLAGAPRPAVGRAGHLQAHAAAGAAPRHRHPGIGRQPALPAFPDSEPCLLWCKCFRVSVRLVAVGHLRLHQQQRDVCWKPARLRPPNLLVHLRQISASQHQQGGVKAFLSCLRQHAPLVRSADDPNTWLVNDTGDPLQRSLW